MKNSLLDNSPRLSGIVQILKNAREPLRYSELYTNSQIRFKQSFLKYLKFCSQKQLIERKLVTKSEYYETLSHSKHFKNIRSTEPFRPLYKISQKGRQFLELIQ